MNYQPLTYVKTCAECKRTFECTSLELWAYRVGAQHNSKDKMFCSWKCLRKWEKESQKPDGRQSKTLDRDREIYRLSTEGVPRAELSQMYGLSRSAIQQAICRIRNSLEE